MTNNLARRMATPTRRTKIRRRIKRRKKTKMTRMIQRRVKVKRRKKKERRVTILSLKTMQMTRVAKIRRKMEFRFSRNISAERTPKESPKFSLNL